MIYRPRPGEIRLSGISPQSYFIEIQIYNEEGGTVGNPGEMIIANYSTGNLFREFQGAGLYPERTPETS